MADKILTTTAEPKAYSEFCTALISDGVSAQASIAGARELIKRITESVDDDECWQAFELLDMAYKKIDGICLQLDSGQSLYRTKN